MRALVLGGASGLLGQAVAEELAAAGHEVFAASRADFDPTDDVALRAACAEFSPTHVLNTVAYTAVDAAEDEPDAAHALNAELPDLLARTCSDASVRLVHFSTDFVFGTGCAGKQCDPLTEEVEPRPRSVYGVSKLEGEKRVLAHAHDALVIRVAWLYGPHKANFVSKICGFARQRASQGERLTVVADQYGSPTCTTDAARATRLLCEAQAQGIVHVAGSGITTWHGLAAEAVRLANIDCEVAPIATHEWPAKAPRPCCSALNTARYTSITGETLPHWTESLAKYVDAAKL